MIGGAIPLAAKADPTTSKVAAARAAEAVDGECQRVLAALIATGRGSARAVAAGDDAFRFVVAKRLSVLERLGLAERCGMDRDPNTGRMCEAWRATSAGLSAVRS